MSVTSGFFNSLSGDRKYDAIQISSMFDGLITDGIYNGYLESFMVTASSPASMVVTVGEGRCWFNHTWTLNDAPLPLTLDVGDVVLNRIDTIVIDVDSTDTVRACTIKVIKGTPSSQAVRPTLENTETHHQYPLCDISVPAGATTVTQSNITNRRGTSDCPFVATLMESVDVDDLLIQWESQWNDWMTDRANSMDSWTAEQQEAFTTWFQTVQDILDENTAGNLLNRINHRTGINATATYSAGVVAITAPDDAGEILTFVAPSDFLSSDTYTLNGEALTITDLNGEALDDSWKKDSPVTITVSGGKAFFKAGGSGKNDTLPPLLGNMTVEVVEGDENDTYTIKMDKLILDKTTEMVGGAQLEWGEEMPAKPGKGTGGIKTWTRDEIITTAKPYDGLYLGDVTPSDAVTETLIYLPENDSGSVKLIPFIVLSVDYLGGVAVLRKNAYGNVNIRWHGSEFTIYSETLIDDWISSTYINSILSESVVSQIVDIDWPVLLDTGSVGSINRKAVLLSGTEYGASSGISDLAAEGTAFPYFSSNSMRKTVNDDGEETDTWTRSVATGKNRAFYVSDTGSFTGETYITRVKQIRPAFILPKDFKIQQRPDGSYTVWDEQGLLTLGDIEASDNGVETIVNIPTTSGLNAVRYTMKTYNEQDVGLMEYRNSVGSSNYSPNDRSKLLFEASNLYSTLVSTMDSAFSDSLKTLIPSVNVKLTRNSGSVEDVSLKYFILSLTEIGAELGNEKVEGTLVPWYADPTKKAARGNGFTRTINMGGSYYTAYCTNTSGNTFANPPDYTHVIWPVFCLPLTAPIRLLADGTYDLVPEDPALSAQGISMMAAAGTPVQLKDIPVSTAGNAVMLKIPESEASQREYLYLDNNYKNLDSCLALRKECLPDPTNPGSSNYGSSSMNSKISTWKESLPSLVKKYLVPISISYKTSTSSSSVSQMTESAFLPSEENMNIASSYGDTKYEYFDTNVRRTAKIQDTETNVLYYTRDINTKNTSDYWWYVGITASGSWDNVAYNGSAYLRPMLSISPETWFTDNGDGTYTFVGDKPVDDTPVVTYTVEVPHGQKVVFRQFTQNQKKQFQTMLVGGVYPPLGEVEEPFALPEFTGNHAIFGDEVAGRIELYESGDLTLSPGTYDFFLVGGGSGSSYDFNDYNNSSSSTGTSGGGAGYTLTIKDYAINSSYPIPVIVGGPSVSSAKLPEGSELPRTTFAGNPTSIGLADKTYVAEGGKVTRNGTGSNRMANIGYDGGSGGSSKNAGPGGSDGSNGSGSGTTGGLGQGTTTRAFEDSDGTLYAGGGGGFKTLGGPGGGGNGATTNTESAGTPGTPNTGGGAGGSYRRYGGMAAVAAGGSGIVIVRWNNA